MNKMFFNHGLTSEVETGVSQRKFEYCNWKGKQSRSTTTTQLSPNREIGRGGVKLKR